MGLRYWNEVDDEGESSWVFESRDVSYHARCRLTPGITPCESHRRKDVLGCAVYLPAWLDCFAYCFHPQVQRHVRLQRLQADTRYLPIVGLALVFNFSNVVGFTYADRDAQQRLNAAGSNILGGLGLNNIGGQLMTGVVRNSVGRFFR